MNKKCSIYFPTWSNPWSATAADNKLAQLKTEIPNLDIVYLSFCRPDTVYTPGSFDGTGLQFSSSFQVIQECITLLKAQNVIVMLSVGGGSYWHGSVNYNPEDCIALCNDLGCDGIDIDWEGTVDRDYELTEAIRQTHQLLEKKLLSFAAFSVGAFGKISGNSYSGVNIHAMTTVGSLVDWINIMSYDAGGWDSYSPLSAYDCFRIYYTGPLHLGIQVGKQGWGDYITTQRDVTQICEFVKLDPREAGVFVWAYGKDGDPDCLQVCRTVGEIFTVSTPETPSFPNTPQLTCPVCQTKFIAL